MAASWQRLGDAVGCTGIGVNRVQIDPGRLSTPPHSHGASEEIVFVLGGSGFSWQDEQVYELRPGDCVVHLADHEEHTLRGGPDGLEVLICGTRHPTEIGWLPRSGAVRFGWPWVEGRTDDPWDIEAQAEPLEFGDPAPRPTNIVNVDEAEAEEAEKSDCSCVEGPLSEPRGGLGADRDAARGRPGREAQLPAALPRLRGGVLPRPRRRGHVPTRATRSSRCGRGSIVGRPPGTGVVARLPRAAHAPHVRDEGAERHLLLPALEQDRLLGRRRHRPHREASTTGTASRPASAARPRSRPRASRCSRARPRPSAACRRSCRRARSASRSRCRHSPRCRTGSPDP